MGTTHIFSGVVISRMEAKTVCLYAFLLERYYGNKRGIEKIAPIAIRRSLYKIFTKFRRGYKHSIIVRGKYKEHYTLDENELLYAYFTEKRTTFIVVKSKEDYKVRKVF